MKTLPFSAITKTKATSQIRIDMASLAAFLRAADVPIPSLCFHVELEKADRNTLVFEWDEHFTEQGLMNKKGELN